jgi:hypothetical protein
VTRPCRLVAATLALTAALAPRAAAQQGRVAVVVDYIAGADIYLAAGSEQGLAPNDTLVVREAADGDPVGRFFVVSTTTASAVVEFLGTAFPVTRGKTLYVERASAHPIEAPPSVIAQGGSAPSVAQGPTGPPPSLHGRLTLEANGFQSTTLWQSNAVESETRRFATPSLGLRAVAADLPGGFSLNTNLRAQYRYSNPDLIAPAWAVQVYQASVANRFSGAPLYVELGRFENAYTNFSGQWDGLMVRVGGQRGLGAGVAAGFEPESGDQGFSTTLPKYAGFLTLEAGASATRYAASLSATQVRPRNGLLVHSSFGWSQYLRVRRFRFANDLQVDRDPETSRWVVTRLNANTSIPLARGLELHGRLSVFQPYAFWQATNLISYRRDQGDVGLFLFGPGGSVGIDFTANRFAAGDSTPRQMSYTYSASFNLLRTPVLGLDWSASGSYWTQTGSKSLYATAGLGRSFGRVQTRASYQLYRSQNVTLTSVSHSVEGSLSVPLAQSLYATIQGRIQRGGNLHMNGLYFGLWTSF